MNRWLFLWRKTRRQLWVRATAYAVFGLAASLLAAALSPWVPQDMAERLGGESVESILTILASSLLGVATFSVGAMVTAYTSVSSAASPRVAALVTSDEETQKSLATFVGAFLYAVVSVTAINAHYYGQNGRAILFLFSLAMVGLVAFRLLAWINRLSRLARVGHMIELVESYARDALEQRRDLPRLGGRAGGLENGAVVVAPATGYVQNVDPDRLQTLAEARDCQVEVVAAPGAFVRRGGVLARISLTACDDTAQADFCSAFALGDSRSYDQDPRFGLIVLGEIAAKALSPGVNDPGTAIQIIGAGVRLLDVWTGDACPEKQPPHRDRLFVPGIAEADLLDDVFGPVARYGAGDVAVAVRLQKGLKALATTPALAGAVEVLAREALDRSRVALPIAADVARVEAAAEAG
ncbi:DUF2254 domain-containing protein [Brevundimonas mediterranea]|uniref:Putative membrane protein n=1 Tax=Brevundimonas mediterranea TaxID=74329 RepID=A0A7W6F0C3_9CAUL|nr:DUF2254 domain-containing protein [Brevundimonas mediterranea]MBB3872322.1 putative membrane protein [Brevundimonas mediterranea]